LTPPTVEYTLTVIGREFKPIIEALVQVGYKLKDQHTKNSPDPAIGHRNHAARPCTRCVRESARARLPVFLSEEERWTEPADLIIKGRDGAISARTVTYDFARLMKEDGAVKEIKCSESGDAVIVKM
jgi:hypothetical protein